MPCIPRAPGQIERLRIETTQIGAQLRVPTDYRTSTARPALTRPPSNGGMLAARNFSMMQSPTGVPAKGPASCTTSETCPSGSKVTITGRFLSDRPGAYTLGRLRSSSLARDGSDRASRSQVGMVKPALQCSRARHHIQPRGAAARSAWLLPTTSGRRCAWAPQIGGVGLRKRST